MDKLRVTGGRPLEGEVRISGAKNAALPMMCAAIDIEHGYILASAQRLKGARIVMDLVTVTGTENLMMAAVLAEGTTVINNAAREPEVVDLAHCLIRMGAKIEGVGTDTITIAGVDHLFGTYHNILADRIETGTYLTATAMTGGHIKLKNTRPSLLEAVLAKLREI